MAKIDLTSARQVKGTLPVANIAAPGGTTDFLRADQTWATPPGTGGGSTAWALAGTGQTATGVYDFAVDGAKANIDFIGLGSFNELLIVVRGMTNGTSGVRQALVSVDNGSTFYNASGDYQIIATSGVETAGTGFNHSTGTGSARGFVCHIINTKGAVKAASILNNTGAQTIFVGSTSDINAIRVNNSTGGNMTAGTARIFAR